MVVHAKPSAEEFAQDFDTYISIQKTIDDRMGKSIIQNIQGKPFRKKAYWRAVATAFRLTVKKVSDEYFEHRDDWGYHATWVAITETGREVQGEGSFQASEKMRKDGSMVDATHHNVRSTANTRAFNRAVSNCVGFGEVSAEEIGSVPAAPRPQKAPQSAPKAQEQPSSDYTRGWDGNLTIKTGKNKGKRWADLPLNFLEWTQGDKAEGTIVEMGAKELARRAALEGDVVEAEITREPGDDDDLPFGTPQSEDPRLA
jgi:hypothetical protein